ncbi:MAG: hypothetical protein IJ005_08045 [Bacteroidales bacterium]|nr:hypothetical protein [Bacteroidales bacterium]
MNRIILIILSWCMLSVCTEAQMLETEDKSSTGTSSANHSSHAGEEQWSVLQPMHKYFQIIPHAELLTGLPSSASDQKFVCYPRVKKMADGRYIMFYHGGRLGSRIWCTTSDDFINWDEPVMLFAPVRKTVNGIEDIERYVNMDAAVLPSGEILAVCSYRATKNYKYGIGSGLLLIRSTDNGQTWSKPVQICDVCNWEPYLLVLPDGRIHCYFTHGTPQTKNSGTSVLVSDDNGHTWSKPERVCRQYKYDYNGEDIYTDQMPSFRVLNDGKTIVGWLESRLETSVPEDYEDKDSYSSYFMLSLVYNDGLDWQPLGEHSAGPQHRLTNIYDGCAGYVSVFPSGEVILSCNKTGVFKTKIMDSKANVPAGSEWDRDWQEIFSCGGYWGAIEVDSPSTILTAMHGTDGLYLGRLHLNHRIDAAENEWSRDSLYLGTENGAECRLRARREGKDLLIDADLSEGASVELKLCVTRKRGIKKAVLTSDNPLMRFAYEEIDASVGDYICIYAELKSGSDKAVFAQSSSSSTDKWQRILLK